MAGISPHRMTFPYVERRGGTLITDDTVRVRATRLTNANGEVVNDSPWLTLGSEYVVLALYAAIEGKPSVEVRLIPDEGGRINALFDLADFEITDPRPSELWRVAFYDGHLRLEPEAWMVPAFWSVFFGDMPVVHVAGDPGPIPDVTERFDNAVRAMMEEARQDWPNEPTASDEGYWPFPPGDIPAR
jgi:hypothetical protein